MAKERTPLQTWQIWQVARKYIGIGPLAKMFGVGERTIYDYASDPAFVTKKGCREPFERMHVFLRMLDDLGFGQYARAGLAYLATAVEDGFCSGGVREPLATITEEILRDYSSVSEMQLAIERGEGLARVEELKRLAVEEIERTYLRYAKDLDVSC